MRTLFIALSLLFTCCCFSQPNTQVTCIKLTNTEYNSCVLTQPLLLKDSSANDTLILDETKFLVLGVFRSTNMLLLKSSSDNSYSLIDKESGWMERLLNIPIFSSDLKVFGCFGTTFGREMIKLYKIGDRRIDLLCGFSCPKKITQINCVGENSLYAKDIDETCFKYSLKVIK